LGLGPAQPTWAGLDPASLARSLAQASDLVGLSPARVKWTSRVLHCAKVIKLPLHSVYKHNMQRMKGERKERTCFRRRRCLQRWWILAYCFPLSSFCVHLSACSFCFLSSFWSREDDEEAGVLGICFEVFSFLCAGVSAEMKAMAGKILCVCWFPFLSFSLCIISFSGFLLWFWLSFLLWFFLPFYRDPVVCLQPVLPLQDCYFPRTRSWARDVVHDWIGFVADFQLPCWIGMEKTHDCSPATVPFRQKWEFSLWPLPLEI